MAIKIILEPHDDPSNEMTHDLDQSLITVGRSKSCHIELDHPEISRRHFIVKYEGSRYVLFDQHSRHGTSVNGEKLEPGKPYLLGLEQIIEVPGYFIRLLCDGERPRLERTTVVARELLDDLLQGDICPREVPSLRSIDERFHFKFTEEKTTFMFGSAAHADFIVSDDGIAKSHVSFIRDIFGICVIPTPGNEVMIDGVPLSEGQLLLPKSVLKIGELDFIYVDSDVHDKPLIGKASLPAVVVEEKKAENLPPQLITSPLRKFPKSTIRALDRMFVLGFVAACVGAVLVIVNLA